ncbi:N-acetyltransferase [Croceivirga lutea]|uniref:GNAT family N-acetyltransferase n=1 Tax=Croceivirga lutea TaxID=1775167 RepID=UPI00163A5A17|nr:GNAT family N-acetyltransferase [Croceivirga lutea]GGG39409.1 N-acetyltransferase [Croceivirga lutea]
MELAFRKCSLADIHTLKNISVGTFKSAFKAQNNPEDFRVYINQAFSIEQLLKELSSLNSMFYFALSKNEIVGYFKLNILDNQNEFKEDKGIELERIYVLSEFQNRGFGSLLLEEVKNIAKNLKKGYLWLGVWEVNLRAINFYENKGFYKIGTHPYWIGTDKQTDWLMRLDL